MASTGLIRIVLEDTSGPARPGPRRHHPAMRLSDRLSTHPQARGRSTVRSSGHRTFPTCPRPPHRPSGPRVEAYGFGAPDFSNSAMLGGPRESTSKRSRAPHGDGAAADPVPRPIPRPEPSMSFAEMGRPRNHLPPTLRRYENTSPTPQRARRTSNRVSHESKHPSRRDLQTRRPRRSTHPPHSRDHKYPEPPHTRNRPNLRPTGSRKPATDSRPARPKTWPARSSRVTPRSVRSRSETGRRTTSPKRTWTSSRSSRWTGATSRTPKSQSTFTHGSWAMWESPRSSSPMPSRACGWILPLQAQHREA